MVFKRLTIRSFGREIYNNNLSLDYALEQQIRLKDHTDIFEESTKPKRISQKRKKKALTLKNPITLLNGRQKVLNAFESGLFPKRKQGKGLTSISDNQLKILTPKTNTSKISNNSWTSKSWK